MTKFRIAFSGVFAASLMVASASLTKAADPKSSAAEADTAASSPANPPSTEKKEKADSPSAEKKEKADSPSTPPVAKVKVKQLSAEMTDRRDKVRRLLTALRTQPFNTQENTCTDILEFCRAFGCDTQLTDNVSTNQKVNGITCLCWNMPCAGYQMMTTSEGHLAARVGYGYQSAPSELAAVLAISHVPPNYPARVGASTRTISDLIEYEKLSCHAGTDMSLKLVALSYYVQKPSWKDSMGGEWTLRRVVTEELNRPHGEDPYSATNRLLGLSSALERFLTDKAPLEGDVARANRYIIDSIDYAYAAQNSDGSWGRATNRDYPTAVAYTARMLEWLVACLPESRLEEPQITRGVDFLLTTFNSPHYQAYVSTMSPKEISAAMHAAYVLNTYDQRVFVPADPLPAAEPAKTDKPEQKSAAVPAQPR